VNRLYESIIEHATKDGDEERLTLSHKVWDHTPFVLDVYVGERNEYGEGIDESEIREYCRENFGKESWPIHNKPGDWYRGGATVDGWTWLGFKTKEMMEKFISDWPKNTKVEKEHQKK